MIAFTSFSAMVLTGQSCSAAKRSFAACRVCDTRQLYNRSDTRILADPTALNCDAGPRGEQKRVGDCAPVSVSLIHNRAVRFPPNGECCSLQDQMK